MTNIPDILATKCSKCGAKISPGYDFCLSCGTKFSEVPPKMAERDTLYGDSSSTSRFLYGCVGAIIVGIIVLLYVVFVYLPGAL